MRELLKPIISETVHPLKLYFPICDLTGPSLGEMIQQGGFHCIGGVATETNEVNVNIVLDLICMLLIVVEKLVSICSVFLMRIA